jgi:hypothetical protein
MAKVVNIGSANKGTHSGTSRGCLHSGKNKGDNDARPTGEDSTQWYNHNKTTCYIHAGLIQRQSAQ